MWVDAGRAERELVHLQLAYQYRARVGELLGNSRVVVGNEVAQYLRAGGGGDAFGEVQVFQADGNTVQRTPVLPVRNLTLRRLSAPRGFIRQKGYEGVQSGLGSLDTLQMRPREFNRG